MSHNATDAAGPSSTHGQPLWLRSAPALFLVFWSGGFAFGKLGLEHAEPMTFLAMRYGCVLIVLLPLMLVARPPLPRTATQWLHLIVVGLLLQALYFGLTYAAFELGISAGSLALIVSLQPVLVALAVPWTAGERVGLQRWIGLLLGLGGCALVILARSAVSSVTATGIVLAIGALVAITGGTLYEKRFGSNHHPLTANSVQYGVAFAALLPIAALTETMQVDWSGELVLSLGYLVICNSLIAITLLLAMIRHGEAAKVSALFFLVPPGAALIAWGLLGETMPPTAWPGIVLAAIGVALASRPPRPVARN